MRRSRHRATWCGCRSGSSQSTTWSPTSSRLSPTSAPAFPKRAWRSIAPRRGAPGRREATDAGRVRTDSSTGATEDTAFAAIQRGPADQLMFRQVLLKNRPVRVLVVVHHARGGEALLDVAPAR